MDIVTPSVTFFPESDYTVIKKILQKNIFDPFQKRYNNHIYIYEKQKSVIITRK